MRLQRSLTSITLAMLGSLMSILVDLLNHRYVLKAKPKTPIVSLLKSLKIHKIYFEFIDT